MTMRYKYAIMHDLYLLRISWNLIGKLSILIYFLLLVKYLEKWVVERVNEISSTIIMVSCIHRLWKSLALPYIPKSHEGQVYVKYIYAKFFAKVGIMN